MPRPIATTRHHINVQCLRRLRGAPITRVMNPPRCVAVHGPTPAREENPCPRLENCPLPPTSVFQPQGRHAFPSPVDKLGASVSRSNGFSTYLDVRSLT